MSVATGPATECDSGGISLSTGDAISAKGGAIDLLVGTGTRISGEGGFVDFVVGTIDQLAGGSIALTMGAGTGTSSGRIALTTVNAGSAGVSGALMFASGTSSARASGQVHI
jgi:hypothetical protein